MLVDNEAISYCISDINASSYIAIDTETNGLFWYKGHRPFCITISTGNLDYYIAIPSQAFNALKFVLSNFSGTIFMHNAKFDLHHLEQAGLDLLHRDIHCTMAMARVEFNNRMSYSLDSLAIELGEKKDNKVKKYITKNKLYTLIDVPGKLTPDKVTDYSKLPKDLIIPYAEKDTRLTFQLGKYQLQRFKDVVNSDDLIANEKKITKVFYDMECLGVAIDEKYIEGGVAYEESKKNAAELEFKKLTKLDLKDTSAHLTKVFTKLDLPLMETEKGNYTFTAKQLEKIKHPIVAEIIKHREAVKRIGTYGAIKYYSKEGICYANLLQSGTATGRISIISPALQCIEKPDEDNPDLEPYSLRGCFVPRKGYMFVMMDFDQFEYRMLLNYAGETSLIEKIREGLDVHAATAEMLNISRKAAKSLNFMLLYGGGNQALADRLGLSLAEGKNLKEMYFSTLPKISEFINRVRDVTRLRGYVKSWLGRKYYFDVGFEYKAVNYIIQGGCAEWLKSAMITIHEFLKNKRSKMLLQIHDELLFEIHEDELDIIPHLKTLMEGVTLIKPHNQLPYTVGIDYSFTNWKDKRGYDESFTGDF